ncbi:hypothetical protein ACIW6D_002688 [Staphylococcus aureus]
MSEPIKEKLELLILKTLKHKENSTSIISNDELEKLFNMYKYLNEPNQKRVWIVDLITCVALICATSILVTLLLLVMQLL